jgi:STAM-binding protein
MIWKGGMLMRGCECRWGVFRLTDPPGMQTVLNCRQTGLFHPHGEANIYTDALKPGHVYEASGLNFEVVDLRP